MSSGFKKEIAFPIRLTLSMLLISSGVSGIGSERITPSTTHTGSRLPEIEDEPLILIFGATPGVPDWLMACNPGIFPCNIWSMDVLIGSSTSEPFTLTTAEVSLRFSITW